LSNNALEVFQICEAKNILTELARFYEEWAKNLEISGNAEGARQIYERGLVSAKDCTLRLKEAYK